MKRILIAEDDRTTRYMLREILRAGGYAVSVATDGLAALKKLRQKPYDLLLLDIWMPRLNGLEVMARLRKEAAEPKVVVLTCDETSETVLRSMREQACRYIRKPVDADTLLEAVGSALSAEPASTPVEVLSARPNWVELRVPCTLEMATRITEYVDHLEADLSPQVRQQMGFAFRELLANAVEWGGKLDPNQKVRISYLRGRKMLLYRIADPGTGFHFEGLKHAALENPPDRPWEHITAREQKGLRPGGFGILMVKAVADELLYNEAQNEVVFVKYLNK
ncbi:MAG: response regulator [Terriglobia bacterium]